ncbi:hypothetical protein K1719_002165 [Acacia pycnantha]|nr:hypothetical protein K1719_002165 [Acacia pycnantha]
MFFTDKPKPPENITSQNDNDILSGRFCTIIINAVTTRIHMFQRHISYSEAIRIQTEAPPETHHSVGFAGNQERSESVCKMQKGAPRVVYPAEYGGDPRREEESSKAFQKALEEAFAMEERDERELVRGATDLGGVVVDMEGVICKIGKPISFRCSAAGNLVDFDLP